MILEPLILPLLIFAVTIPEQIHLLDGRHVMGDSGGGDGSAEDENTPHVLTRRASRVSDEAQGLAHGLREALPKGL